MKQLVIITFSLSLLFCTPKGPQTYSNYLVGKTKEELIAAKGVAKEIKVFDDSEAYIYSTREEYYGRKKIMDTNKTVTPKKIIKTEHIYYINKEGLIYKYQVWKKRID